MKTLEDTEGEMIHTKITVHLGAAPDEPYAWLTPEETVVQKEKDRRYIEKLKEEGRLFEPVTYDLHFKPYPLFNEPPAPKEESFRFVILDFTKKDKLRG